MADAIDAMRVAFTADTDVPNRHLLGQSLFMPGRVGTLSGVKVVSVVPGNPVGVVVVFDENGALLGIVDGPTLTAIRTGAVAGLATDLLASPQVTTMAMLGAGAMARDQIAAVQAVRDVTNILVWSRDHANAAAVADDVGGEAVANADEAVASADVVSTATPSTEPLFATESLTLYAHVNAIGAFTPSMIEIPPDVTTSAFVVVDDMQAAAAEAGDLIQAGRVADADLRTLLTTSIDIPDGRTLFKSVGIASQDITSAAMALANAEHLDLGAEL